MSKSRLTSVLNRVIIPLAKIQWGEIDYWPLTECTCGGVDFHLGGFDAHKLNCAKAKAKRDWRFHLKQLIDGVK